MERIDFYSRLSNKETVLNIWGRSTKHPDLTYYLNAYLNENEGIFTGVYPMIDIADFLLNIASRLTFTSLTTKCELVHMATMIYENRQLRLYQESEI